MNKKNLIIIVVLMLISGLLIYYLYLKPEAFQNIHNANIKNNHTNTIETFFGASPAATQPITTTSSSTSPSVVVPVISNNQLQPSFTCPPVGNNTSLSIISKTYGIGFNMYPVSTQSNNTYLIEHIPIVYNNTLGSMYAVSVDGLLTIQQRNEQDTSQWWIITKLSNMQTDTYVIKPSNSAKLATPSALQYENGSLALRPYTEPGFPGQQWIMSSTKITRGVPVLNFNPASMFTTEFDPYSTSNSITSSSLDQHNTQQVSEVVSAIKSNIQQYLKQNSINDTVQQMSASSLGNKELPLNINLNLGKSTLSKFADITGSTTKSDVLSLLDKYENPNTYSQDSTNKPLYATTDLQTVLQSNTSCSPLNLSDYTSNRVSSCNCKL